MKKTIIAFSFLIPTITFAQTQQTEKKLTVTLTVSQWEKVIMVINKSTASYPDVVDVQNLVIPPLQKQASDTTQIKPKEIKKP